MGRLFLKSGDTFDTVGSQSVTSVFGTNGNETVFVAANGKAIFDPSFNRGGDTIEITGNAANYMAAISGSNLVITAVNGASITIPVGQAATTNVNFADADRTLIFNGTNVVLGAQIITATPTQVAAGQAPAAAEIEAPAGIAITSDDGGVAPAPVDSSHHQLLVLTQTPWTGGGFG